MSKQATTEQMSNFYRQQLAGIAAEMDEAREQGDTRHMLELTAVGVDVFLKLTTQR